MGPMGKTPKPETETFTVVSVRCLQLRLCLEISTVLGVELSCVGLWHLRV